MISKELLSEVINIKIEDIIDLKIFGKDLKYYEKCLLKSCCDGRLSKHKDSICKSINIYELAHKCKEWAIQKGYVFFPRYKINNGYIFELLELEHFLESWQINIKADTEIEAIFKACQWILDNKKEGN